MSTDLVKVTFHGALGQSVGENWDISVSNVSEAIHAIEILSGRRLYKFLIDSDKSKVRYKVLVNNNLIKKTFDENDPEQIRTSELTINVSNLKSVDIVPVIEGAEDFFNIFIGATLMIASLYAGDLYGPVLFLAGLTLAANGIANLLSKPPAMEPFREIQGSTQRFASYLFNGPENTVFEGGPVPVGYGRLMIGSQNIEANYIISKKIVKNENDNAATLY